MRTLVACPSCSTYVRADESACPQCGARVRNELGTVVRTAGAMLMGLSLTACPAGDDTDDTGASSATMTAGSSGTTDPTMSSTGSDMSGTVSTGPGPEPAYGVGTTDTPGTSSSGGSSSSSGGDTEGTSTGDASSSTSIGGPEYGVPETTGR